MIARDSRRAFLTATSGGILLAACTKQDPRDTSAQKQDAASARGTPNKDEKSDDVGATEDLMREHGVIRRVLVVYRESASRLRVKPADVSPDALQKAAKLMRSFGEDYHEKQLEEAHLFPVVKKAGGAAAALIDTLVAQHQRGREITEYVIAATTKSIAANAAAPLAQTLEAFARMYEAHAAFEDTLVFPAWKKALSPKELDETGDLFEDIEHKTFGKDGFNDAVEQIAAIEKTLGVDPASMTAAAPPKT